MAGGNRKNESESSVTVNVSDIQSTIKTLVNKICASEEFITEIANAITLNITQEIQEKIVGLEKENQSLKASIQKQDETIQSLSERLEKIDQNNRNRAVRIYGIGDEKDEDTGKIVLEMLKKMKITGIDRTHFEKCYRIGKARRNKNRPVYVSFVQTNVKNKVYGNKKYLKGTGIVMREDLTAEKLKLVKATVDKIGSGGQVWTSDGRIFVKIQTRDGILKIVSEEDVKKLKI